MLTGSPGSLRVEIDPRLSGSGDRPRGFAVARRFMPWTFVEVAWTGRWLISGDGWEVHSVAGQVVVVPANLAHAMLQTETWSRSDWWAVSLLDPLGRDLIATATRGWLLSADDSRIALDRLTRLVPLSAIERPGPGRTDALAEVEREIAGLEIVRAVLADAPERLGPAAALEPRLERVLAHIAANLDRPIRRAELAELAHLSETRFSDVFTAALGLAPGAYVIRERIRRAQELLAGTDASVAEIARECGYAEASRFSREFRQRVGRSPREFRSSFSARRTSA